MTLPAREAAQSFPGLSSILGAEDAAAGAATVHLPSIESDLPHGCIKDIRMLGINGQVGTTGVLVYK